jgi:dienelactone hydrolase
MEPHYVAAPLRPTRDRLFVFFHATGNFTDDYQLIVDQAARSGFHAVGLRYFSQGGVVADLCRGSSADCSGNVRREQVSGNDVSPQFVVSRANSVENRLLKILAYLDARDTSEGWGSFVRDGGLVYSKIHAAGHSQGASVAAYLAKDAVLARVVMFAGPVDNAQGQGRRDVTDPSAWLVGPHATPASRYYAFGHSRDGQINLQAQWAAVNLGMEQFGPPVNVDRATPPYGGGHLLLTDAAAAPGRKPVVPNHGTTIRDDVTPKALDGQPLFAPVWQYMCFS